VAATSARVYRDTFRRWEVWAADNGLAPLDLNYNTVSQYLTDREGTKASRQRELAALRKLAEVLAVVDFQNPARKAAYDSLKMLKVRNLAGETASERDRRALSPAEADRMLRVHADNPTAKGQRDRAIVATLLLTGLRRAEAAALRWANVDFQHGTITVRHGKGDKARQVAIYGQEAIDALRQWQLAQPSGYEYVFVNMRKGDNFTGDKPMTTTSIWRIVEATAEAAGIGHVKPHDLRGTLATELLSTGTPVHDVANQLGHANASTTLNNYATATEARERRKRGKVRYG